MSTQETVRMQAAELRQLRIQLQQLQAENDEMRRTLDHLAGLAHKREGEANKLKAQIHALEKAGKDVPVGGPGGPP